ncbi:MAG TPA: acyl-CoA thioesterase domain-containing protein [Acidimicrobiales bacterium]|jgi:acyl-CoA thioesterase|nr:acyl-CoA thioesterase domain-containing protein [Acidimicrobiales bacterium]
MTEIDALLATLALEPTSGGSYRGTSIVFGAAPVVFGGQLLAQSIVAGAAVDPTKEVKSIHTVFARGASTDAPLEFDVDVLQTGRSFASASVTARQGSRLCTRSLVLLHQPEPDLIRHQPDRRGGTPPMDAPRSEHSSGFWEVRVVDGVDVSDPGAVGPAELDVWTRFIGAPADATINQALLAFASDGFLIGTAMRPHAGIGQSMAHVSISTTVITHTLVFHESVDAGSWMLLSHESPAAGRGRSYGRAHVFSEDGGLVASFAQENMIRHFTPDQAPQPGRRSAH